MPPKLVPVNTIGCPGLICVVLLQVILGKSPTAVESVLEPNVVAVQVIGVPTKLDW